MQAVHMFILQYVYLFKNLSKPLWATQSQELDLFLIFILKPCTVSSTKPINILEWINMATSFTMQTFWNSLHNMVSLQDFLLSDSFQDTQGKS